MNDTAESQPSHDSSATESRVTDAEQSQPSQDAVAIDGSTEHTEAAAPSSSTVLPGEPSVGPDVEPLSADDIPASPLAETILPPPSPSASKTQGMPTTVEDCPDDGEAGTETTHTPSPLSAPSRTTTVMTPATPDSARLSVKSETTVTQTPHMAEQRRETASERRATQNQSDFYHAPRPRRRPSALDYLVSESLTGIPRAALETSFRRAEMGASHTLRSSTAPTTSSVLNSHPRHDGPVDTRPSANWTPGYIGPGEAQGRQQLPVAHAYASPPMAHASARMASMPMPQATPSLLPPAFGFGVERPPMSGYQLLAAKLVGGLGGPPVTPMYRRFEGLNHRLLLYMQADLMDLEHELRALDMKDTIERGYGLVPASRRHERWADSTLAQQRTEVLGQIGYKLCQYNKVISSFRKWRDFPPPSLPEIHEYKSYLTNSRLLTDDETGFLDMPDDLASLVKPPENPVAEDGIPPVQRLADEAAVAAFPASSRKAPESEAGSCASTRRHATRDHDALGVKLAQLALAMFVSVFVPVVTFAVIPGFAGRVTVVVLVGTSVATALMQSGLAQALDRGALDWILCAGVYGATMAAVAGALA